MKRAVGRTIDQEIRREVLTGEQPVKLFRLDGSPRAKENVDHLRFLLQLCELELLDRERRAAERRLKAAKFPGPKTLDTFDFKARSSINKLLVLQDHERSVADANDLSARG